MSDGNDVRVAAHYRSLGRVFARHEQARNRVGPRVGRHGQNPTHRPHAPIERQLAHEESILQGLVGDRARGRQHAHRDRHIEGRAVLLQIRGSEVHGDSPQGILEPAVLDGAANTNAPFFHPCVGKTYDVAAGQPLGYVHFNVNGSGIDADDGCGKYASKHEPGYCRIGAKALLAVFLALRPRRPKDWPDLGPRLSEFRSRRVRPTEQTSGN